MHRRYLFSNSDAILTSYQLSQSLSQGKDKTFQERWRIFTCLVKGSAGQKTRQANVGLSGVMPDVWPPYSATLQEHQDFHLFSEIVLLFF